MEGRIEERLRVAIKEASGIAICDDKAEELLTLVGSRARMSVDEFLLSLKMARDLPEWLVSTLTVNETYFFRHPQQFIEIRDWLENRPVDDAPLHCVSLGCSTGQEPYSLAMMLAELPVRSRARITAIDLDVTVIKQAREGVYSTLAVQRTPGSYRALVERRSAIVRGRKGVRRRLDDEILAMVEFKVGNCIEAPIESTDLILARNVLIYFEPAVRAALLRRLIAALRPGGLLVIGAGELFPPEISAGDGSTWQRPRSERGTT